MSKEKIDKEKEKARKSVAMKRKSTRCWSADVRRRAGEARDRHGGKQNAGARGAYRASLLLLWLSEDRAAEAVRREVGGGGGPEEVGDDNGAAEPRGGGGNAVAASGGLGLGGLSRVGDSRGDGCWRKNELEQHRFRTTSI